MDARARLRAYLEQRRELGESEFVLDGMSVEDALGAIDKLRPPPQPRPKQQGSARPAGAARIAEAPVVDLPPRAARVASERPAKPVQLDDQIAPSPAAEAAEAAEAGADSGEPIADAGDPKSPAQLRGLVVGTSNGTLFEQNPYHGTRSLDALARIIADCTRCELYSTAKNAVPGEGNPDADFMVVGEAPGANEDESGQPFVGQAGGLLTKILAAIDLSREQVFITNVIKHRPPGNRNPQPDEVEACSPYLVRQIQMVKPKVILALGTFAAQTLLQTKTPIGKLRGAVHRYYGIPLIVTYHPAALLRNPAWKRPTWEDVKLARHVLDTSKS